MAQSSGLEADRSRSINRSESKHNFSGRTRQGREAQRQSARCRPAVTTSHRSRRNRSEPNLQRENSERKTSEKKLAACSKNYRFQRLFFSCRRLRIPINTIATRSLSYVYRKRRRGAQRKRCRARKALGKTAPRLR